jgi:transcriptional regulator with GAF, ATPase, and Fis domain
LQLHPESDVADGKPQADGAPPVGIWDPDRERAQGIAAVAARCGASFGCAHARLALVFLGTAAPDDDAIERIRRLARGGARVIAYADGADRWPLGSRCRALLAGAVEVLDSAAVHFASGLATKLGRVLALDAEQQRERSVITRELGELGIVGVSDAIAAVFRRAVRVSALSDLHTLITGESGTGKQLLAEAVHRLDPKRRRGPFVALNCGAISAGLAESELFGHRRGAFTGADRDRRGLIRAADGGVLFLDEVGELEPALQTKLLRVLQEGRVLSVGDDREVPVSLRVVAATNRDLEQMVRERAFRADLFHRLNVLSIHIPPLRERPADVGALVRHFVGKYGDLRPGRTASATDEFIEALARDDLPGNARQVENIVRRAIVHKDEDGPLTLRDLPPDIWERAAGEPSCAVPPAADGGSVPGLDVSRLLVLNDWNLTRALDSCERSFVEAALQASRGNQTDTARLLGITPRSVYNKIRKHHLAPLPER